MSTTDPSAVPSWPRVEALVRSDGSAEVTINGTSHPLTALDVTGARTAVVDFVVDQAARKVRRPVRVETTDPDGTWTLLIDPEGTVQDIPGTRRTRSAVPPEPRSVDADMAATVTDAPGEQEERGAAATNSIAPAADTAPPAGGADEDDTTPPSALPPLDEPGDTAATGPIPAPAQTAPPPATTSLTPDNASSQYESRAARRAAEGSRSFLTRHVDDEPAHTGLRGFFTRLGLRQGPSEAEKSERADMRAVSQHWPGPRTIAVVNGKGGAGKTPTTVLLSALFARHGGSGVLAWDNNETRGTLGWRTEQGPHEAHVLDLLPHSDELMQPGARAADLAAYVHHQVDDKFDVLRSNPLLLPHQQRLTAGDFDDVHQVATKYFRLIFVDSGNDETAPHWLRMIDHADQIVVATTTRPDHAEAGRLLLDALRDRDQHSAALAEGAVVIVSQADREEAAADAIAAGYDGLAREALTIPYDRALRAPWLRYSALQPATQRAYLRAAAAVSAGL